MVDQQSDDQGFSCRNEYVDDDDVFGYMTCYYSDRDRQTDGSIDVDQDSMSTRNLLKLCLGSD